MIPGGGYTDARTAPRALALLLLLLTTFSSLAGVPVQLPPGESAADWAEPLSLAGLQPGAPGTGPYVQIRDEGGKWTIRVRDEAGQLHDVPVERPDSAAEREEIAFVASSLVKPMAPAKPAPAPPPTPAPAPAVVKPKPVAPQPKPEPPPQPQPEPVAPVVVEAPPVIAEPVEEPDRSGVWASLALGVGGRDGSAAQPNAGVRIGPRLSPSLRVGGGLSWAPPAALPDTGKQRRVTSVEALAGVWWGEVGQPQLGATVGAARRAFSDEGWGVAAFVTPTAAVEIGWIVPLGEHAAIEPLVRVSADGVVTDLLVDGEPVGSLGRIGVVAGATLLAW